MGPLEHALLRGGRAPPEGERTMHTRTIASAMLATAVAFLATSPVWAGCGCDKPAPPRATIRPFVAGAGQTVTLFNPALQAGATYDVAFESAGAAPQWVRARADIQKDIADGVSREHLRVSVPELPLGPCAVRVWRDGARQFDVAADEFTVAAHPIALHDGAETTSREYRAAVGADGTVYIPVDMGAVSAATRFTGTAQGLPLQYQAQNVAMYNDQGYLMQLLDPKSPRLFDLTSGDLDESTTLSYWRHEFQTYKQEETMPRHAHDATGEWHADGTRHVDHDHIIVALRGAFADGTTPAPGATPPFNLVIASAAEQH